VTFRHSGPRETPHTKGLEFGACSLLAATFFACAVAATGCSSGDDRSLNLDDLRNADAPYYYVGRSFDGYAVSDVLRYRAGEASILYGTCKQPSGEGGCGPPLQLQHRLCLGVVTISIFAERDTARRAAKALRPLSKGARARTQKPVVVFDTGVSC
jgi:hypothetical protein